jgi:hypothetical protein
MDKGKKSKKKTITINKTPLGSKFGGKKNFLKNTVGNFLIDTNYAGNVFYNEEDRNLYQKWEFIVTETAGVYYLKNAQTELFLTSDEVGNLYTTIGKTCPYQKWIIMTTSDPDLFLIVNSANDFVIDCNKMNIIMLNRLESEKYADVPKEILFKIYQFLPKK